MADEETTSTPATEREQKTPRFTAKRRIIVAIVLLVLVAIAIAVIDELVKTKKTQHESFAGVSRVEVSVKSGDVRLLPSAGTSVDITRHVTYVFRSPSAKAHVTDDGTLAIEQSCGGIRIGACSADYDIVVPGNLPVVVRANSDVTADNVKNDLDLDTSNGVIDLRATFGRLQLTDSNGNIRGRDISSLDTMVRSHNGKVDLQYAAAPNKVDAETRNGALTVLVPKSNTAFKVDADTRNGKTVIDVKTDPESPRTIRAHSDNGDVRVARS